jgi:hypothetical protein
MMVATYWGFARSLRIDQQKRHGIVAVGSKFAENDLLNRSFLFVRVHLPESTVGVVAIVNSQRVGEDKKRKWHQA